MYSLASGTIVSAGTSSPSEPGTQPVSSNISLVVELPLSEGVFGRLAIEAHFRNLSISDLTAKLIIAGLDPGRPSA
jgi:hypothetical protein